MKGNKKILVLAILVLLIAVSFTTYAIYRSAASGTGSINAANWSVKISGSDIDSANFDFGYSDITWTTNPGKNNTIAPGASGYIEIPVDASGSEVDVLLTATITGASLPDGMTATVNGGGSQTITYASGTGNMTTSVRINIEWTGADSDDTTKDSSDLEVEGDSLSIPVTLTAKQALS